MISERTTLHVADDSGRVAMIETRTRGTDTSPQQLQRFIYSNHLGSASLELNESADIISYEEYHPYGTTAYQANNADINAVAKRYRYTGKERDEESGLYYHGARYYIPWLARWTAVDPLEAKYAGWSAYHYVKCNPVMDTDSTGMGGDNDWHAPMKAPEQNSGSIPGTFDRAGFHDGRGSLANPIEGPNSNIVAKRSNNGFDPKQAFIIVSPALFKASTDVAAKAAETQALETIGQITSTTLKIGGAAIGILIGVLIPIETGRGDVLYKPDGSPVYGHLQQYSPQPSPTPTDAPQPLPQPVQKPDTTKGPEKKDDKKYETFYRAMSWTRKETIEAKGRL